MEQIRAQILTDCLWNNYVAINTAILQLYITD
jgi:hypothetical protein